MIMATDVCDDEDSVLLRAVGDVIELRKYFYIPRLRHLRRSWRESPLRRKIPDGRQLVLDVRKGRVVRNNFRILFNVARFRRMTSFIPVYSLNPIQMGEPTQYNAPRKRRGKINKSDLPLFTLLFQFITNNYNLINCITTTK